MRNDEKSLEYARYAFNGLDKLIRALLQMELIRWRNQISIEPRPISLINWAASLEKMKNKIGSHFLGMSEINYDIENPDTDLNQIL